MEIVPVGGVIGAEVSGIDLQQPLSDDQVAQIEKGLIDHLVLFFRDQNLTDQGQRDFAARFGPLGLPTGSGGQSRCARDAHPEF